MNRGAKVVQSGETVEVYLKWCSEFSVVSSEFPTDNSYVFL